MGFSVLALFAGRKLTQFRLACPFQNRDWKEWHCKLRNEPYCPKQTPMPIATF
jgi:hypothetical protein